MKFVVVGLSHKTAPIELREKIAQATSDFSKTLGELKRVATIGEACVLSTCNRIEFYVAGEAEPQALARDLRAYILASSGLLPNELEPHLYQFEGVAGVRHLFRVSASLDSMVLGEPQILGQVKEAYKTATKIKAAGSTLSRTFSRAFMIAKRIRNETGIAENAVSMSFAAVELGREIFTSLAGKNVLLVGAGKMGTLAAKHLKSHGVAEIRVANRSFSRAEELASEIGGLASSLADLEALLPNADIVISSTAATSYIVDKKMMARVVRSRRYRPILMIDLAVPRDIDPAVSSLENVFVYDVDDLETVLEANREQRAVEAEAAEKLVMEEVDRFVRQARTQEVVPLIKALRERATEIAEAEAQKTLASLRAEDRKMHESVRAMSAAIINKMLHPVLTHIKEESASGDPSESLLLVQRLFGLELPAGAALEPEEGEKAEAAEAKVLPLNRERGGG